MFQSSRRTRSFSSSSPSSSSSSSSSSRGSYYFPDDSPLSAATPIRSFSGSIPFSWEYLPGIPKKQSPARLRLDSASPLTSLLPLPPISTTLPSSKRFGFHDWRKSNRQNSQRDPFFDAFVECSKEPSAATAAEQDPTAELWNSGSNGKAVSRSLSDRFGFLNPNSSCKRTCGVSESIVYRPRRGRSSFDLLNHRNGG
ncbi:uncharacterized protein LOC111456137 [Cucurbita moschata]|uniref:Uncharacterized protein LOC111456137 n=1 Tax=Cucurbita moschata TaxID=3662 RepID=A0A6J1GNZ5_CUCMO|nr:uncharacterized protein LOC111456137 [Cucurbita moschata]